MHGPLPALSGVSVQPGDAPPVHRLVDDEAQQPPHAHRGRHGRLRAATFELAVEGSRNIADACFGVEIEETESLQRNIVFACISTLKSPWPPACGSRRGAPPRSRAAPPRRRTPWPEPWSRTNGVNTNGAAAKVVDCGRLEKKVRPGTFGKMK